MNDKIPRAEVDRNGHLLSIDWKGGPHLILDREEAYALLLVLQEQLPHMAQKIDT